MAAGILQCELENEMAFFFLSFNVSAPYGFYISGTAGTLYGKGFAEMFL